MTGASLFSASWCADSLKQQSYLDHAPKAEASGFATTIRTLNPEVGS
jgi:hypothetical protein